VAQPVDRLDGLFGPTSEPWRPQKEADGPYRMQHDVVDILFSHELLM
jgi:hypothetical protein